jgi:hypothetical protein
MEITYEKAPVSELLSTYFARRAEKITNNSESILSSGRDLKRTRQTRRLRLQQTDGNVIE